VGLAVTTIGLGASSPMRVETFTIAHVLNGRMPGLTLGPRTAARFAAAKLHCEIGNVRMRLRSHQLPIGC
jgi:hypothetical protein